MRQLSGTPTPEKFNRKDLDKINASEVAVLTVVVGLLL